MKQLLFIVPLILVLACGNSNRKATIQAAPLISSSWQDDGGHVLTLRGKPERIISFSPGLTEMLFAIGAERQLVARSTACNFPEDALFLPALDPTVDFQPDSLRTWEPDVVFVPAGYFQREVIESYVKQGIPLFEVNTASLEDIFLAIRKLGDITGRQDRGNEVADSLLQATNTLRKRTEDLIQYGSVILIDSNPLQVAGGKGLFQEMLTIAGGKNRYAEVQQFVYSTTEEELFTMKPEYLFIPSKEPQVYQLLIEQYPAIYNTPAAGLGQVYVLDPDLIYRPGPRIVQGIRQMAQALHAELVDLE